jgi:hypothetical protein
MILLNLCYDVLIYQMEIGDGSELSEKEFAQEIHPAQAEEKAAFKKPTGPKKKAGGK